jgi:hypothetical protein
MAPSRPEKVQAGLAQLARCTFRYSDATLANVLDNRIVLLVTRQPSTGAMAIAKPCAERIGIYRKLSGWQS